MMYADDDDYFSCNYDRNCSDDVDDDARTHQLCIHKHRIWPGWQSHYAISVREHSPVFLCIVAVKSWVHHHIYVGADTGCLDRYILNC